MEWVDKGRSSNAIGWVFEKLSTARVEPVKSRGPQYLQVAVQALQVHLDPGNQTLAAFNFCQVVQKDSETVTDKIRQLKRPFQVGFGSETKCFPMVSCKVVSTLN